MRPAPSQRLVGVRQSGRLPLLRLIATGERAKRASFEEEEDENTRDESREMATDTMATSTTD